MSLKPVFIDPDNPSQLREPRDGDTFINTPDLTVDTLSDLKGLDFETKHKRTETVSILGNSSKRDGGEARYYLLKKSMATINNAGGYAVGNGITMTVDALPYDLYESDTIVFENGGEFVLTADASAGDTSITGDLSVNSVTDNEQSNLKSDGFNVITPTYSGYGGIGRWVKNSNSFKKYSSSTLQNKTLQDSELVYDSDEDRGVLGSVRRYLVGLRDTGKKVNSISGIVGDTPSWYETLFSATPKRDVLGYYSAGDGGGGMFYWDSSEDKANHNGGTIINPSHNSTIGSANWYSATGDSTDTTGSGCWVRPDEGSVNVRLFGAKGDGSNDDYEPLQSAFDYCKENDRAVFIPEGTFRTTGSLYAGKGSLGNPGVFSLIGIPSLSKIHGECTGEPVLDFTGSENAKYIKGITIVGDQSNIPSIGLLEARMDEDTGSQNGPSAGHGYHERLIIEGSFSISAFYNYAAEENFHLYCKYKVDAGNPTATIINTDNNAYGATSPNVDIAGTTNTKSSQSNNGHTFLRCDAINHDEPNISATTPIVLMNGTTNFSFTDGYVHTDGVNGTAFKSEIGGRQNTNITIERNLLHGEMDYYWYLDNSTQEGLVFKENTLNIINQYDIYANGNASLDGKVELEARTIYIGDSGGDIRKRGIIDVESSLEVGRQFKGIITAPSTATLTLSTFNTNARIFHPDIGKTRLLVDSEDGSSELLTIEDGGGSVVYAINDQGKPSKTVNYGNATDTTNGGGQLSIPHGLIATPTYASVHVGGDNTYDADVVSVGASNIVVRIKDSSDNSDVGNTEVTVYWEARR